jgi:hypothetical protein
MRYMMIYKIANTPENDSGAMPTDAEIATMGQFIADLTAEGVLLVTDGLLETSRGARVRRDGDAVTVKDGPFTEAKEVVAGYAIVDVATKEQAIELAKRFLAVAGDGESEIREMYDEPAGGTTVTANEHAAVR